MSSQNSTDKDTENTWDNLDEGIKRAVIALRDFARRQEKDFQYVLSLNPSDLGIFLKEFYLALKENSESIATTASHLVRVRSDLKEYFLKVSSVDITTGAEFVDGNTAVDELQSKEVAKPTMKKHTRQRTFTFETSELRQIYMGDAMNLEQPESLQNKVFFDVCMYICNRGKDFLRLMTKTDFEVATDQNGRRYVWLKYDSKFSFQEVAGGMTCEATPATQIGERMYERPGDPKCPVLSYTKYAIHLHPMSDAFWQRPKRNVMQTDFVWFDNICIGNSTLNKLMNRITQSAGLQDSYAINAIKSSYIPIIESICRSTLFGSQQFRRVLQMKQTNHELHHVRKRHSEGSLSIASTLRESPMFRPRHSESQLPVYRLQQSACPEVIRSNSASPVLRASSWEGGSPHMILQKTPEMGDNQETAYLAYRNSESEILPAGYQQTYRDTGQDGTQERAESSHSGSHSGMGYQYAEENKTVETGTTRVVAENSYCGFFKNGVFTTEFAATLHFCSILHAKQKCLDIVHSLEVRDIKSFINWMKTFEVKHGPAGLMVTCQPVNSGEMEQQQQVNRQHEQNGGMLYSDIVNKDQNSFNKYETHHQDNLKERARYELEAKQLEFNCIGETYCCTSDLSPLKITLPTQETVLLTGLKADTQILIHNKREDENQSTDRKYIPLHARIFTSNDNYDLEQIETVTLKKNTSNGIKHHDQSYSYDSTRSTCFKEEKSIPMKKRIVIDQSEHSSGQSCSQSPTSYPQSRSPPPSYPPHSSPQMFMPHQGLPPPQSSGPPPPHPIPKYRERFPDGWGYIPLQKRQKFGVNNTVNKEEVPLDLIKQS